MNSKNRKAGKIKYNKLPVWIENRELLLDLVDCKLNVSKLVSYSLLGQSQSPPNLYGYD